MNIPVQVVLNRLAQRFPNLKGIGYYAIGEARDEIENGFQCLGKFNNLSELHLCCRETSEYIQEILELVPNIKLLSLLQIHLFHPPAAVRRIAQTIERIIERRRNRFPANDCVQIVVNQHQYREFKAIKNISHKIKLSQIHSDILI